MANPKDPSAGIISRPKRAKRGAALADGPAKPPMMVGANEAEEPGPDSPPAFKEPPLPPAPYPSPKPFTERMAAAVRPAGRPPLPPADRYLVKSPPEKLVVVRPGASTWIRAGKVLDARAFGMGTIQMIYSQGVDLEPLPPDWKPPKRR